MNARRTLSTATLFALGVMALSTPTYAQDSTPTVQQLEQQINAQEAALQQTRRSLERLKIQMQAPAGTGPAAQAPGKRTAQNATQQNAQATGVEQANEEPVGRAPPSPQQSAAAKVAPILEQPGILTPHNQLVLEPSLQYDYSNNNQVNLIGFSVLPAIVVGLIDVREVDTSTATAALTARYGLTNRFEVNAKLPYVASHQTTLMRPLAQGATNDQVFSNSGNGIGDLQLGARYQFNDGGPKTPYLIGSLQASLPTGRGPFDVPYSSTSLSPGGFPLQEKQPTGTGFYALDAGLLALYPSDPAVFFGGLDYVRSFSKNVNKTIGGLAIGKVTPGNAIKLSFGMGMALNDKASFSVGYQHSYVTATKYDGFPAIDSQSVQVGQLMIGYGYQLTPKTNLNLTLGVGVTKYAPAAQILLRVPMTF